MFHLSIASFRISYTFLLACMIFLFSSCHRTNTLFETVSSSKSNITFTNQLEKKRLFSILYYLYYYNGGGVSTGDINNDGLPDIYFTANSKGHNKLYLNKGNFQFEDITASAGVAGSSDWCSGVTMADVNSDGLLDIYVSTISNRYGLTGHNELYINNGNNRFTESSEKYGLNTSCFTSQSAFFDYDHDGDLDCYILNQSHHPHANIVDTSNRHKYDSLSGDRLYRNDISRTGKFTDVSKEAGIYQSSLGYGLGLAVSDLNNDGWDDIYVGNDFHENDYYYVNQQNGTFKESGAEHFRHYSRFSMGNDVADYNNDGNLDVVTVDMLPPDEKTLKTYGSDENPDIYKVKLELNGYQNQNSKNCLQLNNGNGSSFSEIGLISGISATDWSWCPLFADFDNDGNKDLFISNGIVKRPVDLDYVRFASDLKMRGMDRTDQFDDDAINAMPDGASHPYLYKGDGILTFTDVSSSWGIENHKGYFNGAAYADLDNDGDLDLVINCLNAEAMVLRNNAPPKNYLTISFKGDSTNQFAIGAKAYVFQKGRFQFLQLMPTRGFQSSSDMRLHFGLNNSNHIDSVLIVWPDQKYQVEKNVPVNRFWKFEKRNTDQIFDHDAFFRKPQNYFKDITPSVNCAWKHRENDFTDFNVQYLIPHKESTRGPHIAVADVNGDGLDDMYLSGAKYQPGTLMIQQKDGSFQPSDTSVFAMDAICEDVDAVFFDANNDHHPDLYVVSGGNQASSPKELEDRLYINDSKGHFTKATGSFPQEFKNKSCVTAADIDHDGDTDLFVGTLSNPTAYGLPQTSFLFLNDGQAHFSKANSKQIQLDSIGMVTSAAFSDINNDGWQDLIVTGEWMPIKIYINHNGNFTENDIPNSTGLWQNVYIADPNGDGYMDFFAGNWGHNTKLWAGKNGPCKLFVKDFDRNGSTDQIMAYTINGKEYSFLAKDELERSIPVLKKAYLNYGEVAGKTVEYMMYDLFAGNKELTAEELGSCYFENDKKGGFKKIVLPPGMQLSPIFTFQKVDPGLKDKMFLSGGNFFDVTPYEGRYDARALAFFRIDNYGLHSMIQPGLDQVNGQVRDIKWIRTARGRLLVVAKNDEGLLFLKAPG